MTQSMQPYMRVKDLLKNTPINLDLPHYLDWQISIKKVPNDLAKISFTLESYQSTSSYFDKQEHPIGIAELRYALDELDTEKWNPIREIYTKVAKIAYPQWGDRYCFRPLISLLTVQHGPPCSKWTKTMHPLDELLIMQQVLEKIDCIDPELFIKDKKQYTTHIATKQLSDELRAKLIRIYEELAPTEAI